MASKAKREMDEHVDALQKSTFHKNGACVCRHEKNRKSGCHYDQNGFKHTRRSRAALYSSPTRFDAEKADRIAQKGRWVGRKKSPRRRRVTSPARQTAEGRAGGESIWNVGASADGVHENFKPRSMGGVGFYHPYFHEWHHMIANAMLVRHFHRKDAPDPYVLLELLMAGKYNINHPRNIVLLPQQKRVGDIIHWPIHPNNHGKYDAFAKSQLGETAARLEEALDEPDHPVREKTAKDIAEDLHKISDRLFKILDAVGKEHGGVHVNQAGELYAQLLKAGRR